MKQDFNSIHSKLYRWFWIKDKMPENLCPYARRSIGMYLLILPYVLLSIPVILIEEVVIKDDSDKLDKTHHRPLMSMLIYLMLFLLYCAGYTLIFIWNADSPISDSNPHKLQFSIGIIIWFFAIFIPSYYGIKILIENIKEKIRDRRYEKQFKEVLKKPDNWLVAFYKAHHDKICPKIEWLNVPEKNTDEKEDY